MTLAAQAVQQQRGRFVPKAPAQLRVARTCYRHLAGRLGVQLLDALVEEGLLAFDDGDRQLLLTPQGHAWLQRELGVPEGVAAAQFKPCLDWTERRFHAGGAGAEGMLDAMLHHGWLARRRDRQVRLTDLGLERLCTLLPAHRQAWQGCVDRAVVASPA